MRQIILFLCTVLFFISCKEKINSVQDVMDAIAPNEQKFTIDPATDNIIKGEKGTQVFIPANALKFKDGTTPSGRVKIELKEFFSVSEFISNNLSTMSDSFLLETNGMLYIFASADGKELVIDNNKSYTIAFSKNDSTKNMELFYGDSSGTGNVNWQLASPRTEGFGFGYDSLLVDSALYDEKIKVCGWTWMTSNEWGWKLNHPDSNLWNYVERNLKLPENLNKELCDLDSYLTIKCYVNNGGKIYKTRFNDQTSLALSEAISNFFRNIPPFDMRKAKFYEGFEYGFDLCCHREFNQEKYAQRFKQKYSQYQDKAIEKMDKGDLGIYIFQATKLGWINCDWFYEDQREKIDFIVNTSSQDSKTFIVFDSINSIMSGNMVNGKFVFPNVPVNSKVKLIAINFENGKPGMAVQQSVISNTPVSISGFKNFTISELEKQLNKG